MPRKNPPPLYYLWAGMLSRCRNKKGRNYRLYGALGVTVCDRWLKFENFEQDVGPRPSKAHSIDRIDPDGDYEPSNVRWATQREQNRNLRNTRRVIIEGVEYVAVDLAEMAGVTTQTIVLRAARGWPLSAVTSPKRAALECKEAIEARMRSSDKRAKTKITNSDCRSHCKKGHAMTETNVYRLKPGGGARCRECARDRQREHYWRHKKTNPGSLPTHDQP